MKKNKQLRVILLTICFLFVSIYCLKFQQINYYFYDIYFNYKSKKAIKEWFNTEALSCNPKELHVGSAWNYLTSEEFKEIILDGISKMDPKIKNHEKIFELGVGVGAALKVIQDDLGDGQLEFGGSDIAENAIDQVKILFPDQSDNFFVGDMIESYSNIPDNYYDHVVSFGALAMYLTKNQMKQAIKEAVRITKPGGSLLFSHFIAPGGEKVGSIVTKIEPSFFEINAKEWGVDNIKIYQMKHQGDRFQVALRKRNSLFEAGKNRE